MTLESTLKKLILENKPTGKLLGKALIVELFQRCRDKKSTFTDEMLVKLANSLENQKEYNIYSRHYNLWLWLQQHRVISQAYYQQVQNSVSGLFSRVTTAFLVEEALSNLKHLPKIMTESHYQQQKEKRINEFLSDKLISHADVIMLSLEIALNNNSKITHQYEKTELLKLHESYKKAACENDNHIKLTEFQTLKTKYKQLFINLEKDIIKKNGRKFLITSKKDDYLKLTIPLKEIYDLDFYSYKRILEFHIDEELSASGIAILKKGTYNEDLIENGYFKNIAKKEIEFISILTRTKNEKEINCIRSLREGLQEGIIEIFCYNKAVEIIGDFFKLPEILPLFMINMNDLNKDMSLLNNYIISLNEKLTGSTAEKNYKREFIKEFFPLWETKELEPDAKAIQKGKNYFFNFFDFKNELYDLIEILKKVA